VSAVGNKWAVSNALKYWTLYNLSEQEVRLLLLTFSDNELKLAKLCRQGDSNWNSVNHPDYAGFLEKENRAAYAIGDGYPVMNDKSDSVPDTGFFGMKSGGKVVHPRLYNRIEKEIPCVIALNEREFKSKTIDLSEGGLYFRDAVPEWVAGYFLVNVDGKFQLMCSLVEDQKEKARVQIVSDENDPQYIAYKDWLGSLV
jgi:hypothetical protein